MSLLNIFMYLNETAFAYGKKYSILAVADRDYNIYEI